MIIQKVIKGIGGIKSEQAEDILYRTGIVCTWLLEAPDLPITEAHQRLTERNLFWHQNRYDRPDPLENNKPYYLSTPFISTTAGTVERDTASKSNVLTPAWLEALRF